jgi:chitin disaccharide deacetylase
MYKSSFFDFISQKHNKFIINADDFGKDAGLNLAISKSFSLGLVSSTSLIVNMEGFEDAVAIAKSQTGLKGKIGLHLNLTEGVPLTDDIKKCTRFCTTDGHFVYKRKRPIFFLRSFEIFAVRKEIKAQIDKSIAAGIYPSHVDSHHHVHTEWGITKVLLSVLKGYSITKIRSSRNLGIDKIKVKQWYKKGFNYYIKNIAGFSSANYFGSIHDLEQSNFIVNGKGRLVEIMVHPMFDRQGKLVDDDQEDLTLKLNPLIEICHVISPNEY